MAWRENLFFTYNFRSPIVFRDPLPNRQSGISFDANAYSHQTWMFSDSMDMCRDPDQCAAPYVPTWVIFEYLKRHTNYWSNLLVKTVACWRFFHTRRIGAFDCRARCACDCRANFCFAIFCRKRCTSPRLPCDLSDAFSGIFPLAYYG